MRDVSDVSDVASRVAALDDVLRDGADGFDAAGRLDRGVADALAAAGAFSMFVPAVLGGAQLPVAGALGVIERVARRSGSAGWCVMIGATTGVLSAWLPREGAQEIYGADPQVITGGAYAPTGRAVRGDGGFVVSGRWEWGSGSEHCSWLLGGARLVDADGEPITDPAGRPTVRLCYAPADHVEIVPHWDVLGMRGTGSHDLVMDAVTVPDRHTVSLVDDEPWADGALYRFPPFGLLALGIAAVALGVGRAAVDAVQDLAGVKVPMGARRPLGDRSTVRAELARCESALRSARAYLFDEVAAAWEVAAGGGVVDTATRAGLRLAAVQVTETVADLTARLHRLAGGTAVREGQVIERCFRDAHVATQHVLVNARLYETVGTVLLGGEPGFQEL
jgi:indole-3-acetate monooxygenase